MFSKEARYYNFFHKDKDYVAQAKKIRANYPHARTVLEVGSGTGNMTKELLKQGFVVTCVEPSEEMIRASNGMAREIIVSKIENLKMERGTHFDLVLALYDVLNYVPFDKYESVVKKLHRLGMNVLTEIWPAEKGVRFFTYKKYKKYHRVRLAFGWSGIARIVYIYWGMGLVVDFHKMYLHK